jgi:hypothetical protein
VPLLRGVYPYRSVWGDISSPVSETGSRVGELSGAPVEPVFTTRTPIRPVGGTSYPDGGTAGETRRSHARRARRRVRGTRPPPATREVAGRRSHPRRSQVRRPDGVPARSPLVPVPAGPPGSDRAGRAALRTGPPGILTALEPGWRGPLGTPVGRRCGSGAASSSVASDARDRASEPADAAAPALLEAPHQAERRGARIGPEPVNFSGVVPAVVAGLTARPRGRRLHSGEVLR